MGGRCQPALAACPFSLRLQGCRSGVRSKAAAAILLDMGYSSVTDVEGGWTAWVAAGLPTEQ